MRPYISVIYYSRNDDHGGNMLSRMQASFDSFFLQFERLGLGSEIIVMDYNPPSDRPPLCEVLKLKVESRFCDVRFITVSKEIHESYEDGKKMPINHMVARNSGIRRAKGEFILSTCIDVLLSKELAEFLAAKKLEKNRSYRIDRIDINRDVLSYELDLDGMLRYGAKNIIDVHFDVEFGGKFPQSEYNFLHTNMSGDFNLLHSDYWHSLHGYPEYDCQGTHADTIFCYMAHFAGAREFIFEEPYRIYHIDHDSRWMWPVYTHVLRNWRMLKFKVDTKTLKELKPQYYELARKAHELSGESTPLEGVGIKIMSKDEYHAIIRDIMLGEGDIRYNGEEWGLANINLPETKASTKK